MIYVICVDVCFYCPLLYWTSVKILICVLISIGCDMCDINWTSIKILICVSDNIGGGLCAIECDDVMYANIAEWNGIL